MNTQFFRIPDDHLFTNDDADNESTTSHSESDESIEPDSTPGANTEESPSPIEKDNLSGPQSDRPMTSLPFVEWPDIIRRQILKNILLKKGDSIIPYYHEGSVEGSAEETKLPNYDITMLLATASEPRLYEEALKIFYGKNIWEFRNPRVAQWWLKKLGTKVALLRHIEIYLTQGVWGPGETPVEKLWYMLIVWMKPRVKLDTIEVSFANWNHANIRIHDKPPAAIFSHAEARFGVWSTLLSFREVGGTSIIPGAFVPKDYAAALADTMILKEGEDDAEAERLRKKWHKRVYGADTLE